MNKYFRLLLLVAVTSNAQATVVDIPVTASIVITNEKALISNTFRTKQVYLMDLHLTLAQKQTLLSYNSKHEINIKINPVMNNSLPVKAIIGMNGIPILDQGKHGSCVTFANTAAMDAILGRGDYISQLCILELSSYLSNKSIYPQSGWNGTALGAVILSQISAFGFINKDNQKIKGCGGLYEYPTNDSNQEGQPMSLDEFKNRREAADIGWHSLLTLSQRLGINPSDPSPYNGNKILRQVKQFLSLSVSKTKNNPVGLITFGAFLPVDYCQGGACARRNATGDTWAITTAIDKMDPSNASLPGHEMIIMGYDDTAIAIDNEKKQHKGLLLLRSSWGDNVGDNGNYYMTYDFFKKFVIEVQLIYQPSLPE